MKKKADTPSKKESNKNKKAVNATAPKKEMKEETDPSEEQEVPSSKKKRNKNKKSDDKETPKKEESEKKDKKNSDSSFISSKKFTKAKSGYAFRMGPKGIGYYVDTPPKVDKMKLEALIRSNRSSSSSSGKKKKKNSGGRRRSR